MPQPSPDSRCWRSLLRSSSECGRGTSRMTKRAAHSTCCWRSARGRGRPAFGGSQFRRTRSWRDLLLLTALVTVSSTDFAFSALPALSDSVAIGPGYGVRLVTEVIVAVAFALAAFAPSRKRVRGWVPVMLIGVTCLTALVVAVTLDIAAKRGITQADLTSSRASAAAHTTLWLWVTIASAATQLVAGAAFAWRIGANERGSLLAGACFLLTAVRLQYVAVPVVASDWVTPADALRVLRRPSPGRGCAPRACSRTPRARARDARCGENPNRARFARWPCSGPCSDRHPGSPADPAARRRASGRRSPPAERSPSREGPSWTCPRHTRTASRPHFSRWAGARVALSRRGRRVDGGRPRR